MPPSLANVREKHSRENSPMRTSDSPTYSPGGDNSLKSPARSENLDKDVDVETQSEENCSNSSAPAQERNRLMQSNFAGEDSSSDEVDEDFLFIGNLVQLATSGELFVHPR
jgi:hypothetical protein